MAAATKRLGFGVTVSTNSRHMHCAPVSMDSTSRITSPRGSFIGVADHLIPELRRRGRAVVRAPSDAAADYFQAAALC
jgi:hypothetical protein